MTEPKITVVSIPDIGIERGRANDGTAYAVLRINDELFAFSERLVMAMQLAIEIEKNGGHAYRWTQD